MPRAAIIAHAGGRKPARTAALSVECFIDGGITCNWLAAELFATVAAAQRRVCGCCQWQLWCTKLRRCPRSHLLGKLV